jgi:hypothetical protein
MKLFLILQYLAIFMGTRVLAEDMFPTERSFMGCIISQSLPFDSYSLVCNQTEFLNPLAGKCNGFNKTATVSTCSVNTSTTPIAFSCDMTKYLIYIKSEIAELNCKVIPSENHVSRLPFPCAMIMNNDKDNYLTCLIPTNVALPSPYIPNLNSTKQFINSITNTESSTKNTIIIVVCLVGGLSILSGVAYCVMIRTDQLKSKIRRFSNLNGLEII